MNYYEKIIFLVLIIVLSFGMVTASFSDSRKIEEGNDIEETIEIIIPEYEVEQQEMLHID